MPGHSRSKDGIASLAYVPGIHAFCASKQDVDGRDKPGHDAFLAFSPTRLQQGLTLRRRSILIEGELAGGQREGEQAARRDRRGQRRTRWQPRPAPKAIPSAQAQADTFPKLLLRNARLFADRPALRHKDLGIWQTWSWARLLDEVRAYAVGLNRLGVRRGDAIAIVGANRPKIYASVMAAQTLGAIPVPVYADAVANELAYVLAHAEVKFAAVEDQEQVDKIALDRRSRCRSSRPSSMTSRKACANTTAPTCATSTR